MGSSKHGMEYFLPDRFIPIFASKQCEQWRIDNQFVGPSEMTFCPIKGGKLCNVKSTMSFGPVRRLNLFCILAMFDITCFPAFVEASDVISNVLSKRYYSRGEYCVAYSDCVKQLLNVCFHDFYTSCQKKVETGKLKLTCW